VGVVADDRFERVPVSSRAELHQWLLDHHGQAEAVWLQTWKKSVPDRYVSHEDVLDELVAFGWIDGTMRRIDDQRVAQLVSPRRTQPWARSYKIRAERLIASELMHPAGLASVEAAKTPGMWEAMNDVDDLVVPDDLAAALAVPPPASDTFAAFPPSTRRNILRWIASARTAPTRSRRIATTAADAQHGIRTKSNG